MLYLSRLRSDNFTFSILLFQFTYNRLNFSFLINTLNEQIEIQIVFIA